MRTTLEIHDDVYQVARELARERGETIGDVISHLAALGLRQSSQPATERNGVPLVGKRPGARTTVTSDQVRQLLARE